MSSVDNDYEFLLTLTLIHGPAAARLDMRVWVPTMVSTVVALGELHPNPLRRELVYGDAYYFIGPRGNLQVPLFVSTFPLMGSWRECGEWLTYLLGYFPSPDVHTTEVTLTGTYFVHVISTDET